MFAYFIAFLFAYGFQESITTGEHVFFLIEVAAIAAISALISATAIQPWLGVPKRGAIALASSTGATLHLVVLGIGSIISATHKDEGSVSADFSTTTDVLVAIALFAPAILTAWLAWHWWPRREPS